MKPTIIYKQLLSTLFFFFFFYIALSQFSLAIDFLTQGQSLKDNQTLFSSSRIFEFGFFSPGNSTYRYVGIWYCNISIQSVVWVMNREKPLVNRGGSLRFKNDGNLALFNDQGNILWSTNISSVLNTSIKAQVMDTGKLVLRSSDGSVLWDSFDYPTDTFLPGMKVSLNRKTGERTLYRSWKSPNDPSIGKYSLGLDPLGSGQLFIWKGRRPRWRSGQWDGTRFIGSTMRPLYLYGLKPIVDKSQGSMYFIFTSFNNSLLRFVMQYDGVENTSMLVEETKDWKSVWVQPVSQCETYAKCKNYGICNDNGAPICACLKGFVPKLIDEWNKGNWSSGCVRRTQLQCELNMNNTTRSNSSSKNDGFYKMEGVKVPDFANWASLVINETDCRSACWSNCSCDAYSYVTGIGCLMWGSDLLDIYQFNEEGSGSDLYIKLASSELGSRSEVWRTIVIICAAAVFLLIICILLLWKFNKAVKECLKRGRGKNSISSNLHSRREGRLDSSGPAQYGEENEGKDGELPWFNFETILNATSNFSLSNKLGEGGFGGVYKGTLPGGREVAVKKLSRSSGQGHQEFKNEMTLIAKLQHRNLVRLLGCCVQGEEKMLIYEYMPNKSLDAFLFDPTKQQQLDWNKRFSIIEEIARGLVYLHRDSRLRIVHRDLKASNILLDANMNPKISDFGMARIFGSDENQLNTNRVVGTFGYMSPEYAMEGVFSVKSDVYSFGILVLEMVSGRRNNSFHHIPNTINIVGYAWKLWDKDRATEMIDPSISETCSIPQILRCIQIGLLCVQDCANDRPDMPSVVLMLGSENATLASPKAPLFTMEKSSREGEIHVAVDRNETYSVNDVTITQPLGR